MKKETFTEMAERLRANRDRNLSDYKIQSDEANKRISDFEKISQKNSLAARKLREEHLKTD